jgi:peptide/nickel transport system substrate-binding protein
MLQSWHRWHPVQMWALLVVIGMVMPFGGAGWREGYGGAADSGSGRGALMGKLAGPEIITDPAQFPPSFNEPPSLVALVKSAKLPPVHERIGREPLVVKPLHGIGQYGGTWRRGFTGPADTSAGQRVNESDHLTYFDYSATRVVPNIAKSWDVSDDGRTFTFRLRRDMRWSDGHPFTADDFMFWFEDVYQNKDLLPTPSPYLATNGKQGRMVKVDAHSIRYQFADPYHALPIVMAGQGPIMGHTKEGRTGMGGYAPAHYMKQFHPRYVSQEDLDRRVKEEKFDSWVSLFKFKNDWARNPDLPVITPWRTITPITTPTWTLERNPYSIWVDTAGNQLPYIDRIVLALGENLEVINLRAIAGEYDFQSRHIDLQKLPVLLQNQQRGGYKVYIDPSDSEGMALFFNMSYDGDPELAKWIGRADFRRALSLGIDREQLNETFFLGLGVPGSIAPAERTVYSPGPEYRQLWATHDPQKANAMLDGIGLDKKDAESYRLRTDGKGPLRVEIQTFVGFFQATQICEMIREQWRKIGIQVDVKEVERSLAYQRRNANEHQVHVDVTWGTENMFGHHMGALFPVDGTSPIGPVYGKWFASGGTQGKEPPPRMRELMEIFKRALGTAGEDHLRNAKEVWKIAVEEVWAIGTVGQSPLITGVRIVKTGMGNIPERLSNGAAAHSPGNNLPQTYFLKK